MNLPKKNLRFSLMVLFAAIVVAAAMVFYFVLHEEPSQTEEILVAATDIEVGSTLALDHLTTKPIPVEFIQPDAIRARNVDVYIGETTSNPIRAGEFITLHHFEIRPPPATHKIPKEKRALKLSADQIARSPEGLLAGDRVDLSSTSINRETGTHRLLPSMQAVEVFSTADDGAITLLASPEEVELILLLAAEKPLSISARNPMDIDRNMEFTLSTFDEVVDHILEHNTPRNMPIVSPPKSP